MNFEGLVDGLRKQNKYPECFEPNRNENSSPPRKPKT
jgi:hypothetical protein